MKKKVLSFLILYLTLSTSYSQNENFEIQKLALLCKTWGFLKYYHPNVAGGQHDWDKELIKIIPTIKKASDKSEVSSSLTDWIKDLGEIKSYTDDKKEDSLKYFYQNLDFRWINDTVKLNNNLINKLNFIKDNCFKGEQHYISTTKVGKFTVINEKEYDKELLKNEQYRLLSLFRYWNIIQYFYPNKYLLDEKWDNVLFEMIPKFINSKDITSYKKIIQELVAKVDDSHAWVDIKEERKWLPARFLNIDGKVVVSGFFNDSLALDKAGLQLGDIILKANNIDIGTLIKKHVHYVPGSNLNIKLSSTYVRMFSGEKDSIEITLNRNGKIFNKTFKRYSLDKLSNSTSKKVKVKTINEKIGYIDLTKIKPVEVPGIFEKFHNYKAIIIDVRGYPNFAFKKISEYLNSEKRKFARAIQPDLSYPGRFIWDDNKQMTTRSKKKKAFKGLTVILVNNKTISLGEYAVMSLQTADNAITIGNQTAGADGEVTTFHFIGDYKTAVSGRAYFYPDGTQTQRKGIKIDLVLSPTIKGLLSNKDEILDRAIEYIEQVLNTQ
ncbi:S41 family peptidase [Sinomicrobium weinanense]|uniref:Tail specific protease domain-containing protein n=1 Tax=Sinomicrobium weinanense TaxID=2842200 RepID=A0A926Q2R2_9FLAO|nr:S41 family peptidase [Sinomicrobium weinanense]MBC9796793.1 hypothetical protein [Sinomicrobium weinanense]MBU3125520.1 hypothetical protein [Sinomicrobium weinanense]